MELLKHLKGNVSTNHQASITGHCTNSINNWNYGHRSWIDFDSIQNVQSDGVNAIVKHSNLDEDGCGNLPRPPLHLYLRTSHHWIVRGSQIKMTELWKKIKTCHHCYTQQKIVICTIVVYQKLAILPSFWRFKKFRSVALLQCIYASEKLFFPLLFLKAICSKK